MRRQENRRPGRRLAFEVLETRWLLAFAHPGILNTQVDFDRMAAKVAAGYAERRHGLWVLPRDGDRCAYLDDATNLCLIHAERPRACRDYDCRVPWAARNLLAMLAQQGIDATGMPPSENAVERGA